MASLNGLMDMQGKRALITGAGGGLGKVMAASLAELGANLTLIDLPDANISGQAASLAEQYKASVCVERCDLEQPRQRSDLVARILDTSSKIDVLINNAAFVGTLGLEGWAEPFEGQSVETWRRAFEVNLTSIFHLSQLLAPALKRQNGGSIVNVASIYGEYGPDWSLYEGTALANPAAYSASKGGLIQLTRWLATTLSPQVRVNAISPGGVARGQPESFVERYQARTPLRRMANEDDFRGAIAYLSTDMSSYVTGQVLRVDGGWGVW